MSSWLTQSLLYAFFLCLGAFIASRRLNIRYRTEEWVEVKKLRIAKIRREREQVQADTDEIITRRIGGTT